MSYLSLESIRITTIKQKSQLPTHPLHYMTTQQATPRLKIKKQTTFNNTNYTTYINTNPNTINYAQNKPETHTHHHSQHIPQQPKTLKNTNTIPLNVHYYEATLPRTIRRTLAQFRTDKCPNLLSCLNKIDEDKHPSPLCPICKT